MKRDPPSSWQPSIPPSEWPGTSDTGRRPLLRSRAPVTDSALATQCVLDTAERASTATFIYPGVWLAVTLATGTHAQWPWFVWANLCGLLLVAAVRATLKRKLPDLLQTHRHGAEFAFNGLSLLSAAHWGCLSAACITLAPLQPLAWAMLCVSIGLVAGGNTMLGFNPALRYPYPAMMLTPVAMAQALNPEPAHLLMLLLEGVFVGYLVRASTLVHQDYWEGRQARRLAEQQARELELASLTDGLTQVPNRVHFDRQLRYEWARHCRRGGPLSLLVVDLDHFKSINDSFGHPFGDTCLQAVARALCGGCRRATDVVARYGGEEFVVLLPDTDAEGARVVAHKLLEQVRALALKTDEGLEVRVTCSIGAATVHPATNLRPARLVQAADDALYAAKHAGRNRVVEAAMPGGPPISGRAADKPQV